MEDLKQELHPKEVQDECASKLALQQVKAAEAKFLDEPASPFLERTLGYVQRVEDRRNAIKPFLRKIFEQAVCECLANGNDVVIANLLESIFCWPRSWCAAFPKIKTVAFLDEAKWFVHDSNFRWRDAGDAFEDDDFELRFVSHGNEYTAMIWVPKDSLPVWQQFVAMAQKYR